MQELGSLVLVYKQVPFLYRQNPEGGSIWGLPSDMAWAPEAWQDQGLHMTFYQAGSGRKGLLSGARLLCLGLSETVSTDVQVASPVPWWLV